MTVMIRVPNWVGDAVMAEPALRELRRMFSEAHITLVARPWVAGLFEGEGLADEVIPLSDARGFLQTTSRFLTSARRLRRERFDLAVLLQNAFGAALLARAAGARKIAGYPTDGRRTLLDYVIPLEPDYKTAHQVHHYLNIAARLEQKLEGATRIKIDAAQPRLRVTEEARERAERMLERSGIILSSGWRAEDDEILDSAGCSKAAGFPGAQSQKDSQAAPSAANPAPRAARYPIVALNPGATNSRAKQWLAERFAETADRLAERDGFQAIIVGAPGDIEAASEVAKRMRSRSVVLAGRTSIAELKAVLSCAQLVISNDTGAAHVSAALGVPTVVIFGPTKHLSTRPLSDVATFVRHDVECSPCMLRDCPIDHRCMTRVEVSDVYLAAQNLLMTAAR